MYFYISVLCIPVLFYLQEMEHVAVITWLLFTLLICIDALCRQYIILPDSQTALTHSICADPVIF